MEYYQEIKWHEHAQHIINTQKNIHLTSEHADALICSGDKRAKAHRIILTLCSDFFYDILKDYPVTQDMATIILPELNTSLIDPLITFMYTGQVFVAAELVYEFVDACKRLKLKGVIQFSKVNEKNSDAEYLLEDILGQDIVDGAETYEDNIEMDEEYIVDNIDQNESQDNDFRDSLLLTTVDDMEEPTTMAATAIPNDEHSTTIEVFSHDSEGDDEENNYVDVIANESSEEYTEYDELKDFPIDPDPKAMSSNQEELTKKSTRKYYTEETLLSAFDDLANGSTILDTCKKYNVPRSTLYCKIRANSKYSYLYRSIRATAIQDAKNAVVYKKLSLQQAASQFGIAKTVLWRRLRESSQYKPEDKSHMYREEAMKAIKDGEKLLNISKMYNIPISTLHRDKVKLMQQGELPKHCTVVKREAGPEFKKRIEAALESCRNGMTQKMASELHRVPKTTIWRYMNAKTEKVLS